MNIGSSSVCLLMTGYLRWILIKRELKVEVSQGPCMKNFSADDVLTEGVAEAKTSTSRER